MVLLHVFDGDRFLGQSLVTMVADHWMALARMVTSVHPSGTVSTPFSKPPVLTETPALAHGFGPGTIVRVMQIILMNDAEEPPAETPLPKATPISSVDDLQLRAASVRILLESSRVPSPQERADGMHTITILRALAKERLSIHGNPNEHVRIVDAKMRPS